MQALGVCVYDDPAVIIRAVRLVIVAVGPQHARQLGTMLVSKESLGTKYVPMCMKSTRSTQKMHPASVEHVDYRATPPDARGLEISAARSTSDSA